MVQARQAVLSLLPALLATQAAAQYSTTTQSNSVSAQTTVNLFLGAGASGAGFAGTVVNADSCGSTIGIACTSGGYSNSGTSGFCIATDTAIGTYVSDGVRFSTQSQYPDGGFVANMQTCSLDGTTKAVCSLTESIWGGGGKSTTSTTVTTLTGNALTWWQVPITAGATKLTHPPPCTSSSGSAAAATGFSEVIKIMVIPGAAALLAGAFA